MKFCYESDDYKICVEEELGRFGILSSQNHPFFEDDDYINRRI